MTQGADVRVRLIVDNMSKEVFDNVRSNLKDIGGLAKNVGSIFNKELSGKDIGKFFLPGAAAAALVTAATYESYEAMKSLGEAAVEAANAEAKQIKSMSGVLMLVDGGAHSMKELKEYSEEVFEELEGSAAAMGKTPQEMTEAFNALMERGGLASEQAKELTQDMALVGKVTRGGMEGLAQGFSMMEMGVVRARNPIVQLIASTHLLKGNAHAVAQQLQHMTPEKQMEIAEKAIAKQAELMRKGGAGQTLGLDALKTSFGDYREMFLASMGKPMLDALLPPLNRVQKYLQEHIDTIKEWGAKIGEEFAKVINGIVAAAEGIYTGIKQDWQYIQDSFEEVFGDWYRAWNEAMGDTDDIKAKFAQMTDDFIRGMKLVAEIIKAAAEVAMDASDLLHGRHAGTTQAEIQQKSLSAQEKNVGKGGDEAFYMALDKYKQLAQLADRDENVLQKELDEAVSRHEQWKEIAAKASTSTDEFGTYFQVANKDRDEGEEKFMLALLHGSDKAKDSLEKAADKMGIGFDDFMKTVEDLDPELAKQVKGPSTIAKEGGIKASHNINFNNNTFHLKQDFKDQDPDRIALVFRRDLEKHATARVQSTAGSYGGL